MFDRLGAIVSRHWLLVLLAWVVLVALIKWKAPRWEDITHDGDFAYLPASMTSVEGEKLLEAAFPDGLSKSQVALIVARADGKLQGPDFEVAERLRRQFAPGADDESSRDQGGLVTSVWDYDSEVVGRKLISRAGSHGQAVLIVLRLRNEFMAVGNMELLAEVYQELDEIRREKDFPAGLVLGVTGSAAVGYDYLCSAAESIRNTERTTIVLVVLILLLVYRAPGLVIVPLTTIAVSVWVAKGLVAMLAQLSMLAQAGGRFDWFDFKVFSTTEIFIIVILFGAGTDYCLFLISRYREELRRRRPPADAVAVALGQVGDALAASALTTVFGLGMMFFARFGKFSNSGPAIGLCLLVALAACVTLAPALLRASGRIVFWPWGIGTPGGEKGADDTDVDSSLFGGFWRWLSRGIITRPGLILLLSLLLISPLVVVGFRVPITYDLLSELDPDRPSKKGTDLLCTHFLPGETGPVTVLAHQPGGDFDTQEGRSNISLLTKFLYYLEYTEYSVPRAQYSVLSTGEVSHQQNTVRIKPILSVRSLTEPLGDPPGYGLFGRGTWRKLAVLKHPKTTATFLSHADPYAGNVTRFDLVFQYDPFSHESVELLNYVQQRLDALAEGSVAGWPEPPSDLPEDERAQRRKQLQQLASAWQGAKFYFVGTTAGIRDLETVTASDQRLIQVLVVIAVLAILILILRRPVICVYLILSVLLGYFVTIGITELFFWWLYGDTFHGLDWKVPIFLFVILIAVGEDYNIYLATRVFEEQQRRGLVEGLRVAVVRTGGIITSCGVIMAGTFASMLTGTLGTMQQLGFALSLGVLLDTFIIRTILVPAFLALLARRETSYQARRESSVAHGSGGNSASAG